MRLHVQYAAPGIGRVDMIKDGPQNVVRRRTGDAQRDRPAGATPTNWPLLLLIVSIPLQNIYLGKIPSLGGGINYLNVVLLVAFIAAFRKTEPDIPVSPVIGRLIVALLLTYLLSVGVTIITVGHIPEGAFVGVKDIFVGMAFYFLTVKSVQDERHAKLCIAASLVPLPYMFYVFRDQLMTVQSWHYSDEMRLVAGTFMELGSNEIAAFFATYTLILVAGVIFLKDIRLRLALLPFVFLNAYCVLYGYSRGAYLSFAIGLLVLVWKRSRPAAAGVALAFLLATSVFLSYLPVSVQERVGTIVVEEDERDASAQSRFELWSIAMAEYKKSPIFGIGFHAFREIGPTGQDTHNYFVKSLTEQGIIGFGLVTAIFLTILGQGRRLARQATSDLHKAIGAGMVACTIAVIVGNMFGDRFTHYPLIAYFWMYAGLVSKGIAIERRAAESKVPDGTPQPA